MWLFGYGTLLYKADFQYEQKLVGKIKGYSRRLYQISVYARGNLTVPGRVLTIIPNKHDIVWGIAYKLNDDLVRRIMTKLTSTNTDGYRKIQVKFYPKKAERENLRFTRSQLIKRLKVSEKSHSSQKQEDQDEQDDRYGGPFDHQVFSRPSHTKFSPLNLVKHDKAMEKRKTAHKDNSLLEATRQFKRNTSSRKAISLQQSSHVKNWKSRSTMGSSEVFRGSSGKQKSKDSSILKIYSSNSKEGKGRSPPNSPRVSIDEKMPRESSQPSTSKHSSLKEKHSSLREKHSSLLESGARKSTSVNQKSKESSRTPLSSEEELDCFDVFTFIGTSDNYFYSFESDIDVISQQVVHAKGTKGTNAAYVVDIAEALRELIPFVDEEHFFNIESRVKKLMTEKNKMGLYPKIEINTDLARALSISAVTPDDDDDIIEK